MKSKQREIKDYDESDTSSWIDLKKPKKLSDLGFQLPKVKPTQVVSIRFPTSLLNQIRSWASEQDVPYQALIKFILTQAISKNQPKLSEDFKLSSFAAKRDKKGLKRITHEKTWR